MLDGELREAVGTRPESSYTDLFLPDGVRDYGVIWLTDYEDTYYVNNPKVVRLDDGNVAILWENYHMIRMSVQLILQYTMKI